MRFFPRFCLCWRSKERLKEEDKDAIEETNMTNVTTKKYTGQEKEEDNIGSTTYINSDQEASPERTNYKLPQVLSRLRFWDRRKGPKRRSKRSKPTKNTENEAEEGEEEEEEHQQQHRIDKEYDDFTGEDCIYETHDDDPGLQETSRDSLETIIL